MKREELLALADRVEALTGEDHGVNCAVEYVRTPHWTGEGQPRRYTASLDAAMSLVPEGRDWTLQSSGGPGPMAFVDYCGRFRVGATPALALTAAALRALAEQTEHKGNSDEA
jgi:hypothetical protein